MNRNLFYLLIFILTTILNYSLNPISTGDLSHYIALGLDTLKNFEIVRVDSYTYTQPELNFIYPVLSSLFFASLYSIGGLEFTLAILGLSSVFWLTFWYLRFSKSSHVTSVVNPEIWNKKTFLLFLVSIVGTFLVYVPRCSLLASFIMLYAYDYVKKTEDKIFYKKDYLILFLISAVWVNVHGSFLILSLFIGWSSLKFIANKNFKILLNRALAVVLVNLAALINPHTYKVFEYTFTTAEVSKRRGLTEWFSPFLFEFEIASGLFFATTIFMGFLVCKKIRQKSFYVLSDPFFLLLLMGFTAIRNTYFIFLIMPVFFAYNDLIKFNIKEAQTSSNRSRTMNFIVVGCLVGLVFAVSPMMKKYVSAFLPTEFKNVFVLGERPENILALLSKNKERVFNSWDFGSNLSLERTGQYYIDTRNIIFSDEVINLYDNFLAEPTKYWPELKAYSPVFFLMHDKHKSVLNWLKDNPSCKFVMAEDLANLYECRFTD